MIDSVFPKFKATKTECISGRVEGAYVEEYSPVGGMSLRDEFAMRAMQSLLSNPSSPIQSNDYSGWGFVNCDEKSLSQTCYGLADAMLFERSE